MARPWLDKLCSLVIVVRLPAVIPRYRAHTEGLVADQVSALIFEQCGGGDLCRAGGAAIYQYGQRQLGSGVLRIG